MLDIKHIYVPGSVIDEIHANNEVALLDTAAAANTHAILHSTENPKHSAVAYYIGNKRWKKIASRQSLSIFGMSPRDAHQTAFVNSLVNPNIKITVAVGSAGTGKTSLAIAYALEKYSSERKQIILSKPTTMVGAGQAFGPVPGDVSEKFAPYLASYEIALKRIMGKEKGESYYRSMIANEDLRFVPIEMVRGSEFPNSTVILDEVQNTSWHELKTMISRMGDNTELILTGDLRQIDTGVKLEETGLFKLISSKPFQESKIASVIELQSQYRSEITALVAEVDKWITNSGPEKPITYPEFHI